MKHVEKNTVDGEGPPDLRDRTFAFSVRILKLCHAIEEQDSASRTLARQLLRSGTSVGANIEEAFGGASPKDFSNKFSIASKEARETHYWLRLLGAGGLVHQDQLREIIDEANQLVAILTSIRNKTRDQKERVTTS